MRPSSSKPSKPTADASTKAGSHAAASKPEVKAAEPQPRAPVVASLTAEKNGGALLKLEYAGGLAQFDPVWVRIGERRAGREWVNTRDVKLDKVGSLASTKVPLAPGEPIEAATFAFHTTQGAEELWDNAGHSFGCYVVDAKTGVVSSQ